ncbi:hypothetical protein [Nocardia sp. NPDC056100]|uniref:hypothetical protein n=1 Tax=Nocardia sp. NPDC056100 TaxID=3345712 RepID=UPI0035DAE69B
MALTEHEAKISGTSDCQPAARGVEMNRAEKAVIYINLGVLTTKADRDWAEYHSRQRAHDLGLRVADVIVLGNSDGAHLRTLYTTVRKVDAGIVITPNLGHLGGDSVDVTAFAELQTADPAMRYRWRLRLSEKELQDALDSRRPQAQQAQPR